MKSVIEQIRDDYPAYDPVEQACQDAGISRELFRAALSRVVLDGYYGPISDKDWEEQDGREPYSVKEALKILQKVSDEIEGYREYIHYGEDDDGEIIEIEEETVDANDIRRDIFSGVVEIYGGLPW